VNITGTTTAVKYVYANQSLALYSNAYVVQCDDVQRTSSLSYTWLIRYSNSSNSKYQVSSIPNQSKDPSELLLGNFSLLPLNYYSITLTVKDLLSGKSTTSSSVHITVLQSKLVAIIVPSGTQTLPYSQAITLNASNSYDPDQSSTTQMLYKWSCSILRVNNYVGSCYNMLFYALSPANTGNQSAQVKATANDWNATFVIVLTVMKGSRVATVRDH
jgi:hypothetical protein